MGKGAHFLYIGQRHIHVAATVRASGTLYCTTRTHVDAMDDFCWVGGHGSLEAERMSSNTQAYVHASLTRNAICRGCARFEHTYESMMPNPVSHCSPSSSLPASGEQMTLRARMALIFHHSLKAHAFQATQLHLEVRGEHVIQLQLVLQTVSAERCAPVGHTRVVVQTFLSE